MRCRFGLLALSGMLDSAGFCSITARRLDFGRSGMACTIRLGPEKVLLEMTEMNHDVQLVLFFRDIWCPFNSLAPCPVQTRIYPHHKS
jgi:hypothetical protein